MRVYWSLGRRMRRKSKAAAELILALLLISAFAVVCFGTAVLSLKVHTKLT
jgi:hypothetical protein